MNPTYFFAAFLLSGTMGMALSTMLLSIRPEWHRRKRIFIASLFLPLLTLLGLAALLMFIQNHPDALERGLAARAALRLGATLTAIAFFGSLAGAAVGRGGRTQ